MDYVQARPCVPGVVRGMDEFEQGSLPRVHRGPVYLVPHIYLGGKEQEYEATECRHGDQPLHPSDQLGPAPVVPWADQQSHWVE